MFRNLGLAHDAMFAYTRRKKDEGKWSLITTHLTLLLFLLVFFTLSPLSMEYFHVEDSSNFPTLASNGSNTAAFAMQDLTNTGAAPRPSKRPQAHMGGTARPLSPTRQPRSPPTETTQHVFSAAAPAWHPPQDASNASAALPPPPPPPQQATPENYNKMTEIMSQMQNLMSQWVQLSANGAPAQDMKRMMDQVHMLQRAGAEVSGTTEEMIPFAGNAAHNNNNNSNAAGNFSAPRPARRPTASAAPNDDGLMMPRPSSGLPHHNQAPHSHHHNHGSNHSSGFRRGGYPSQGGPNAQRSHGTPSYLTPSNPHEPQIIALVEFKRQRMKKFECDLFISPGHYVVVEGDRGLDCGFVIHCCIRQPDGSITRQESIDNAQFEINRIKSEPGRVVRLASKEEVDLLHGDIASEERVALKSCREIAARLGLNMEIVDCEYQFDRKKVSFYFEAPHSIDFRELNTELFRMFGVRIWLENLNSKVKNVVPEGALSHADKMQYVKNGLRAPRRT